MKEKILVGAHMSIAKGVHNALLSGHNIGATTVQIFTSNQKQWNGRTFSEEDLRLWFETLEKTQIQQVMSHSSYLINLGSPKPDLLEKSRRAFQEEIHRCLELDLSYLNFHPGAATGSSEEECLDRIVESLRMMQPLLEGKKLRLLLETTAGQGTSIGHRFEHLNYIIQNTQNFIPIGVCIDTCHIFVAGYDIRDAESWNQTLEEFDHIIGLKHLYGFHVNDSMKGLNSNRDRHASLGQGEIGLDSFHFLMTDPRVQHLPKYLETPDGDKNWKTEITLLKEMANHAACKN